MLGSCGCARFARFAMKASYRDTRVGFRVGNKGRKPRGLNARRLANGPAPPRRSYPKIKPRRIRARTSFSHDFIAPMMIVVISAAVILAAAGTLPVNGAALMVFVLVCAGALVVGRQVANSMSARRRCGPAGRR